MPSSSSAAACCAASDAGGTVATVLDAINTAAGPMVGHEYAARYVPTATKTRAESIAGKCARARTRGRSQPVDGRDREDRGEGQAGQFKIEIGTPRRDLDYTVQPMGRGSFGGNMLIASTWRHREEMKRIGRGNADRRWDVLRSSPPSPTTSRRTA